MHPGSFSATSDYSTVSGCSPLRMGSRIPKNGVRSYVFSIQPHYDEFIAAEENHALF